MSNNQQYNLKWTNHTNSILQVFAEKLMHEHLVDVTLACEGHFIKAHKVILAACSLYFDEIFKVYTEKNPLIVLNGMHFNDLKQLVEFMYRGEVRVQSEDIDSLLCLAENLQVKGLCNVRTKQMDGNVIQPQENSSNKRKLSKNEDSADSNSKDKKTKSRQPNAASESVPKENKSKKSDATENNKLKQKLPHQPDVVESSSSNHNDDDKRIVGPPNAFMIFANEWRTKLASENPGASNREISVKLGELWRSLPSTQRNLYYTAAKVAYAEHNAKYSSTKDTATQNFTTETSKSGQMYHAVHLVQLVMNDSKSDSEKDDVRFVEPQIPVIDISEEDDCKKNK